MIDSHCLKLIALCLALVAPSTVPCAVAKPKQTPNSRVILDLPDGFEPSPLFSGFQNDDLGVSIIVMELPGKAYEEVANGFTPEALAKKGVQKLKPGTLARTGDYVYMRGEQTIPAGTYAKYFVVFKTEDQTVLVSANVPTASLARGAVKSADIEAALTSARTINTATIKETWKLGYLGPFKESGRVLGNSKFFTLDGNYEPEHKGEARTGFLVVQSLDLQPAGSLETLAELLLQAGHGYKNVKIITRVPVTIAGLEGFELMAEGKDPLNNRSLRLLETVIERKDGGYFFMTGTATVAEAEKLLPQFRKMAKSFTELP